MTIDIVDYSDEIYEALTSQQYYRIELAQHKKNTLMEEFEEDVQKAKQELIKKGTYVSELFNKIQERLRKRYEGKVEMLKKEITVYIENTMRPGYSHGYDAPYVINYALSQYQRYELLKKYYTNTYPNAAERFEAFQEDVLAPTYIEEYYELLFSQFGEEAQA